MQCPFCQTVSSSGTRACRVCGGPLNGPNRLVSPSPRRKNGAPPTASSLLPIPILPVGLIQEAPPAKPVLFAQKSREKGAPRIVAALFWQGENESHPLFVLENGELQLWDVKRNEWHCFASPRVFLQPGLTTYAAVSPHGGLIATGHLSGQVRLRWLEPSAAPAEWKCHGLEILEAHRGCVLALAIAKTRLFSAGSDGAVVSTSLPGVTNSNSSGAGKSDVVLEGFSALSCLAVSPDGRLMALGADDGQVQIWHLGEDGTPNRLDWTSRKNFSPVKSLMFSPNGNMLLSWGAQGVCLWAAQTGHRLQAMAQPHILPAAFADDSRLLAYADTSNTISLCDAWTGALCHTLPLVGGQVQALSFAPAPEISGPETLLVVASSQQIVAWQVSL